MSAASAPAPGPEGAPGMGPAPSAPPEVSGLDQITDGPGVLPAPETPTQAMNEAYVRSYYSLQDRIANNPVPTQQELEMGAFVEEIQPQVRDAVLLIREKGYGTGNVLHAGFRYDQPEQQAMALETPLSPGDQATLEEHGFVVEEGRISFMPENPADLESIKRTWDWLASALPNRGVSVGPSMFGNAVQFREAAADGTLINYYRTPDGALDPVGTKYLGARDPDADNIERFLSPDDVSATRELTFIDQYHALKDRLANNPVPTAEELNMGSYEEELEPQVREAVMEMRRKGYNTGSSGFEGQDYKEQAMDIATTLDDVTKARLAERNVKVTDRGIRFRPDHPSNLESVKKTWDLIADILPDLGKHAEPAENQAASIFRHATRHGHYDDYLEYWVWQTGALNGDMAPLAITLANEGRDFGSDVHAAAQAAEARYREMAIQASREEIEAEHRNL